MQSGLANSTIDITLILSTLGDSSSITVAALKISRSDFEILRPLSNGFFVQEINVTMIFCKIHNERGKAVYNT